jgi:hypothetical protein
VELATALLGHLNEYLTELAHIWRAEGEIAALKGLGVEAVADLLNVSAGPQAKDAPSLVA